jgi:hypothetical protein
VSQFLSQNMATVPPLFRWCSTLFRCSTCSVQVAKSRRGAKGVTFCSRPRRRCGDIRGDEVKPCSEGALPQPFVPSKDWDTTLEEQCTEEMLQRVRRYARRRARGVGSQVNDDYSGELVQDALADTASGVLRWDPSVKTLEQHILDVIKTRTHYDRKRARRFPHESLDVLDLEGETTMMAEVEAALLDRSPEATDDPIDLTAERFAKLRQLAVDDRTVTRLLDALARGATSKADVLRLAELSSVAYVNARRRLRRLLPQLASLPGRTRTSPQKEHEHATR